MYEKLLFYNTLTPEERVEVDAYLEAHPELRSGVDEMRRLGTLFESVRAMMDEPIQDEALVYYVVNRCYSRHTVPEALQDVFRRVDARIASDPDLRARYEHFCERLQGLERRSDPAKQFERLAGFRIEEDEPMPAAEETPADRSPEPGRAHAVIRSLPRPVRWAAVAAVVMVALYGALYAVSVAVTPEHERLAAIDESELLVEGFDVRGRGETPGTEGETVDALYLDTLVLLQEARASTLGLFPRYDNEVLATAEQRLEQVVGQTEPGSFVYLDAMYFLGKVRLAQGDTPGALEALQEVVRGEGRLSEEAYTLLVRLAE